MGNHNRPILQNAPEFLKDLAASIGQAKKRIWIQVMIFEIADEMEKYILLLTEATKRGVDVWIIVDWITERFYDDDLDTLVTFNPFRMRKRLHIHAKAQKMFARVQKAGIHLVVDKMPGTVQRHILIGNRNHNKLFIIDDVVWTGGMNFITSPHKYIDFMVKIRDSRIMNVIEAYFNNKPNNDTSIQCTPEYRFLVDSGRRWSSLIYDEALSLISHAKKEIVLVSQLLPDSRFLKTLIQKSLEHVRITIIVSHKDHNMFTRFPFRIHLDSFLKKIDKNFNIKITFARSKIHAKLLLVDNEKAIFGSHNFASWNELIGIEETGFLTTDKLLIKQFDKFWKKI